MAVYLLLCLIAGDYSDLAGDRGGTVYVSEKARVRRRNLHDVLIP